MCRKVLILLKDGVGRQTSDINPEPRRIDNRSRFDLRTEV